MNPLHRSHCRRYIAETLVYNASSKPFLALNTRYVVSDIEIVQLQIKRGFGGGERSGKEPQEVSASLFGAICVKLDVGDSNGESGTRSSLHHPDFP